MKDDEKEANNSVSLSPLGRSWRRFKKNRLAIIGAIAVLVLGVIVIFAPFFAPYDYRQQDLQRVYVPPQLPQFIDNKGNFHFVPFIYGLKSSFDPTTFERIYKRTPQKYPLSFLVHGSQYNLFGILKSDLHLFGTKGAEKVFLLGTDAKGRDLLSRIIYAGRISLSIAFLGGLVSVVFGSSIGGLSGYYGGAIDNIIQRIIELIRCFPKIPVWMSLAVSFPRWWPSIYVLYGMIGIFALLYWTTLAREVRGKIISYREEDYVMAAKAIGANDARIIFRHLLPMAASHIIVVLTVNIPWLILSESMLSFLGLGIQPPMASWGTLLRRAQSIEALASHLHLLIPGIVITGTVLCFNFFGDGLRDAADPFSQQG